MAKLTLGNLTTLVDNYIKASNMVIDSTTYAATKEAISGLVTKIAKQVMNDSEFSDRLRELDGEELGYGNTIEEYFINLSPAKDHDPDGATNQAPDRPDWEDAFYSTGLGRKTWKTTVDDNKIEKAMLGSTQMASVVAVILKRLQDSHNVWKYASKRNLLGKFAAKFETTQNIELAKPTDTTTGETWTKRVKEIYTDAAEFQTEKYTINKVLATAPSLVLYVKGPKIIPTIDVDVLAGAFNQNRVQIPIEVKAVEDFGPDVSPDVYAILVDPRGVKLHPHRFNATHSYNAEGEFTNYYLHVDYTGYLSPFTTGIAFKEPAA